MWKNEAASILHVVLDLFLFPPHNPKQGIQVMQHTKSSRLTGDTCSCFKQHLFLCEKILSQADCRSFSTTEMTRSEISFFTQEKQKNLQTSAPTAAYRAQVLCHLTSQEYVHTLVNNITITKSYLESYIHIFSLLLNNTQQPQIIN